MDNIQKDETPEQFIIRAGTQAARKKYDNGSEYGARIELEKAAESVSKYRNRHSGTSAPTITASPMYFTGREMRDDSGNVYDVVKMSDGSEYGCSPEDAGQMTEEMRHYHQTRRAEVKSGWGVTIFFIIAVLVVVGGLSIAGWVAAQPVPATPADDSLNTGQTVLLFGLMLFALVTFFRRNK